MTSLPILDVSAWEVRFPEPGGSDANVWLCDPDSGEYALFKPVVAKEGRRQGEDWAEKAVEQVAALIAVPSARILMVSEPVTPASFPTTWPRLATSFRPAQC